MKTLTQIEQAQVVGGMAYTTQSTIEDSLTYEKVTLKNPFICDYPLPKEPITFQGMNPGIGGLGG